MSRNVIRTTSIRVLLALLPALLTLHLDAVALARQNFENSVNDTWSYTADPEGIIRYIYWGRCDQTLGGAGPQDGSWYWASWDLDALACSLVFNNLLLPPESTYTLDFWYYTNGLDPATDLCRYCVEYDTTDQWTNWTALNPNSDAWTPVSVAIPIYATSVRLKVEVQYDGLGKYAHWDNFSVSFVPGVPAAPLIYNVSVAQRTDGSRLVDIGYSLFDANGDLCEVSLVLSADGGNTFTYVPDTANLSGDIGQDIAPGVGKAILWNAGEEGIELDGNQYMLRLEADDHVVPMPENFVHIQGGTIFPTTGIYTAGLTVADFYVDKYELTQSAFGTVMGYNPASGHGVGAFIPVYSVSWFTAIEYCNRRSQLDELDPCYSYLDYGTDPDNWPAGWNANAANHLNLSCDFSANGYRMLREAEWEYAARGGLQTHGYTFSGSNNISAVAWWSGNNLLNTAQAVGLLSPNELGIYDMTGNVSEWCWDRWDHTSSNRVFRGGSWYDTGSWCTVYFRNATSATMVSWTLGFRICRTQ